MFENVQSAVPATMQTAVKLTALPDVPSASRIDSSRSPLMLDLLDDAAHDVEAVVDAEADADGHQRQRVDVDADPHTSPWTR